MNMFFDTKIEEKDKLLNKSSSKGSLMNKSRSKFLANSREEGDVLVGPSMVTMSFNKDNNM